MNGADRDLNDVEYNCQLQPVTCLYSAMCYSKRNVVLEAVTQQ